MAVFVPSITWRLVILLVPYGLFRLVQVLASRRRLAARKSASRA